MAKYRRTKTGSRRGQLNAGSRRVFRMPLLARKGVLAIAAVLEVAVHAGAKPVSAEELAKRYGLPTRHLEPLLQALVREGILRGIRGPRGGYHLGRPGNSITAERILRTVRTTEDGQQISLARSQLLSRVVVPALGKIESAFSAALARINVADLTRSAARLGRLPPPRRAKRGRRPRRNV
jgi:Rrf2 family transcriptional regulator, iron-sulfur cluster assembly transcription factor